MQVNVMTGAEQAAFAALDASTAAALAAPPPGARYVPEDLQLPEPRTRAAMAFAALRDEIAAFDAWSLGLTFEVPMVFLQGDQDLYTPTAEVANYVAVLQAPSVRLELIAGGGHSAVFMRDAFLQALLAWICGCAPSVASRLQRAAPPPRHSSVRGRRVESTISRSTPTASRKSRSWLTTSRAPS